MSMYSCLSKVIYFSEELCIKLTDFAINQGNSDMFEDTVFSGFFFKFIKKIAGYFKLLKEIKKYLIVSPQNFKLMTLAFQIKDSHVRYINIYIQGQHIGIFIGAEFPKLCIKFL